MVPPPGKTPYLSAFLTELTASSYLCHTPQGTQREEEMEGEGFKFETPLCERVLAKRRE